jgi:hypothetical protein
MSFKVTPNEIGWTSPSHKYVGEVAEYAGVVIFLRHAVLILSGMLSSFRWKLFYIRTLSAFV